MLGYALWQRTRRCTGGIDVGRGRRHARSRGADPARQPDVRRRRAAMSRRGALVQQLNAIESLASVDVVCLDKTGTLTEPRCASSGSSARRRRLRSSGSAATRPRRRRAERDARGDRGRATRAQPARGRGTGAVLVAAPLERRKRLGGDGYVLGAPEHFDARKPRGRAAEERRAAGGSSRSRARRHRRRLDRRGPPPTACTGSSCSPSGCADEAQETVELFRAQGVELKVLSGDSPETVAAIARDAGIPRSPRSTLGAAHRRRRAAARRARARGDRPHLAGGQAARRRGAARRRPLRRDGRRRRQRRSRAEGVTARDRTGQRHADGPQRRRHRARATATSPPCRRWSPRGARSSATCSASQSSS